MNTFYNVKVIHLANIINNIIMVMSLPLHLIEEIRKKKIKSKK